ncbi:unnamed protein product [[Candida] boidinii]|uniref:Unnamed protein product n=1 Tax=Candida boidinii TaxID=5477 RepID=A0A9W6T9I4_CANBO|nr:unnamed protein product [[Candida] boidinii]GMF57891.1 unnamed protein product [[Candida] boidinii]
MTTNNTNEIVEVIPNNEILLKILNGKKDNGVKTKKAIILKVITEIFGNSEFNESANKMIRETPTPNKSIENKIEMNNLALLPNAANPKSA